MVAVMPVAGERYTEEGMKGAITIRNAKQWSWEQWEEL